jgi:hypothetical protein
MALSTALGIALSAVPLAAQDAPLVDFNGALNDARVTDRMVRQAQRRGNGPESTKYATPGQAAACAKKAAFRDQFGANHGKVRKLYELCRGVGL